MWPVARPAPPGVPTRGQRPPRGVVPPWLQPPEPQPAARTALAPCSLHASSCWLLGPRPAERLCKEAGRRATAAMRLFCAACLRGSGAAGGKGHEARPGQPPDPDQSAPAGSEVSGLGCVEGRASAGRSPRSPRSPRADNGDVVPPLYLRLPGRCRARARYGAGGPWVEGSSPGVAAAHFRSDSAERADGSK